MKHCVDFGKTAKDYSKYRQGFPSEVTAVLGSLGVEIFGKDVLDIGCGTGSLALLMASVGGRTMGMDPSAELLEQASLRASSEGLDVAFSQGTAEQTGIPDSQFDIVTAGQCWHWFDQASATIELRRVLRNNGRLVIAHFDWIPVSGNLVELTESLIKKYNPNWHGNSGNGIYSEFLRGIYENGFSELRTCSHDFHVDYTIEAWVGRVRASAGIGASLSQDKVKKFSQELERELRMRYSERVLKVHHRLWVLTAKRVD